MRYKNKCLELLGFISLFFLSTLPFLVGLVLAASSGETYLVAPGRYGINVTSYSEYIIYGSILEVPWLIATLYFVMGRFCKEAL